MAKKKNTVPKRIAGLKIPKTMRRSRLLRAMLGSPVGRDILANAITAGAGAAAAVLIRDRDEVVQAGKTGAKKGARAVGLAAEAVESATSAVMSVVSDAAHSLIPGSQKKRKDGRQQAVKH